MHTYFFCLTCVCNALNVIKALAVPLSMSLGPLAVEGRKLEKDPRRVSTSAPPPCGSTFGVEGALTPLLLVAARNSFFASHPPLPAGLISTGLISSRSPKAVPGRESGNRAISPARPIEVMAGVLARVVAVVGGAQVDARRRPGEKSKDAEERRRGVVGVELLARVVLVLNVV